MIHLYTGEGKGKTTAAVGLAVRHLGSGGTLAFVQFLKSSPSGEIAVLESLPRATVLRNREQHGFAIHMSEEQKQRVTAAHNENLSKAQEMVRHRSISMLVLDELCAAYALELIDRNAVDALIESAKAADIELVITGRDPAPGFVDAADYITEMRLLRHPYEKGVPARRGIEY